MSIGLRTVYSPLFTAYDSNVVSLVIDHIFYLKTPGRRFVSLNKGFANKVMQLNKSCKVKNVLKLKCWELIVMKLKGSLSSKYSFKIDFRMNLRSGWELLNPVESKRSRIGKNGTAQNCSILKFSRKINIAKRLTNAGQNLNFTVFQWSNLF